MLSSNRNLVEFFLEHLVWFMLAIVLAVAGLGMSWWFFRHGSGLARIFHQGGAHGALHRDA